MVAPCGFPEEARENHLFYSYNFVTKHSLTNDSRLAKGKHILRDLGGSRELYGTVTLIGKGTVC